MKDKGLFYVGLMVLLLGALFFLLNVGSTLFGRGSLLSIGRLWPLLIIWAGLAFFLPIFIWWENRDQLYGLAMPGTIILVNGLILLYSSLTRDWGSWAFLWTLEPLAVALGLLALYILGARAQALLIAALVVGGVSLALFAILASALGYVAGGIVGAFLLIAFGVILVVRAVLARPASDAE